MKPENNRQQKPPWLKLRLPTAPEYEHVRRLLRENNLHTVCQEARCPNQWECFSKKIATFLILGNTCTRNCRFCAVDTGTPAIPDHNEPDHITQAVGKLGLQHVVITSVTRDDLADGGASHFAALIQRIHQETTATVEVLIPDFKGDQEALQTVLTAKPEVLNHNIETVPRLYPTVRPQAAYQRSINLLANAARLAPEIPTKSGLMLGLGESKDEISAVLTDLFKAGCQFLTLGQYLQPSAKQLPVQRYLSPDEFSFWKKTAEQLGFKKVNSAPFVRSSYKASHD